MRPIPLSIALLVVFRCAAPAPPSAPASAPAPPPAVQAPTPFEEKVIGTVKVTASALNVRAEASTDAEVLTQVKKGQSLSVLREDESWVKVRMADGSTGWVAARFVSRGDSANKTTTRKKGGCPPDSDYAFTETPPLRFSDSGAHGMVIVEATVNTKGAVTGTKVVSNSTGDEALAFLTQKEIQAAKFSPPIRNCVPRAFVFTYRRTF